ncbi:hypothetical protein [Silvimonas soli]|uniref:hypothetical protein n=1 Tax=Silvimonas soli TaxID=2980100 RepID=UPI0024B353D8|nr:hypothetical protein [Silvimonas soli]
MANAPNHVKHFPPNKSNKDDTPLKNMRFFHYQHIAERQPLTAFGGSIAELSSKTARLRARYSYQN